ncbi:MAG TPA: zinc-binding alcohol dehydrogenase [Paracoccaceae bacterium]|nr:zinc-binding alcohol dehydrogenase [Paracoccaceae bacterium]
MRDPAEALVYLGPGRAGIEPVELPPMAPGMVEVRTLWSALSRGTERLVFEGRVPRSEHARMRAPHQSGDFPFPVRYGYAAVGIVEDGPEQLIGRHVFALHPHQTRFRLPEDAVVPVPEGVPPARAVLAANMETALNALWDAVPAPGTRCLVVGAGLLGWLVTALISLRPDLRVDICDIRTGLDPLAAHFSVNIVTPGAVPSDACEIAFHASATAAGLQTAIESLAFEGRVIELSWFGDRPVELRLGGAFHAKRLSIIASQVGHVARPRRAALTRRDRLARALAALADPRLDALVTEEVAFAELPARLPRLLAPGASGIATRVVY